MDGPVLDDDDGGPLPELVLLVSDQALAPSLDLAEVRVLSQRLKKKNGLFLCLYRYKLFMKTQVANGLDGS